MIFPVFPSHVLASYLASLFVILQQGSATFTAWQPAREEGNQPAAHISQAAHVRQITVRTSQAACAGQLLTQPGSDPATAQ